MTHQPARGYEPVQFITAIPGTRISVCELRDQGDSALFIWRDVHAWEVTADYRFDPIVATGVSGLTSWWDIYDTLVDDEQVVGVGWTLVDPRLSVERNNNRALNVAHICREAWK